MDDLSLWIFKHPRLQNFYHNAEKLGELIHKIPFADVEIDVLKNY